MRTRKRSLLLTLLLSTTALAATSDISASTTATTTAKTKAKSDKILLSRIRSLTLRHGQMTTSRRVSPIPQLKCVGGDAKGLHDVDVMKCTNMDADYDDDDVSWSCEATLPHFFKLGATDVICEGYASSDDPFVLKGSCGVEYILMLTEAGHKQYPKVEEQKKEEEEKKKKEEEEEEKKKEEVPKPVTSWSGMIEFILWLAAVAGFFAFIAWAAYKAPEQRPPQQPNPYQNDGWGPGGGGDGGDGGPDGWGGGGGDNWRAYRDDPPPYAKRPSTSRRGTGSYSSRQQQQQQMPPPPPPQEQWRPGFWTGAATGAAATYLTNNTGSARAQSRGREGYDREREMERAAQERERAAQARERAAQDRERAAQERAERAAQERAQERAAERAARYGGAGPGGWRTSSYGGSSYEGESGSSAYEHTSTGFGQSRRR
ncbi:hypothetical protein TWF481_005363 [Arthrobotrys musiformis]|uniref:Store-operated calcium entry-associated regulatory factor n=1 Tax=Arthrobotrys musiformis TaxID=47236 RepID=A0AAV9WFQ5_9PEZI